MTGWPRHFYDHKSFGPRYLRWVPEQRGYYYWCYSWIHSWHYSCDWNHLENCALQSYYTASNCNSLPTFWDKLSFPSSRVKNHLIFANAIMQQLLTQVCVQYVTSMWQISVIIHQIIVCGYTVGEQQQHEENRHSKDWQRTWWRH
jgi:hypothetical protein